MKATGVVRRIDDLGRVVIPKEIRKVLKIDTPSNIVKETKTTNLRDAFFCLIGGKKHE